MLVQIGQVMSVTGDPLLVARYSVKAEYHVMANDTRELKWNIYSMKSCQIGPMELACHNQSAMYLSSNPIFHERIKYIEVDYHFIREKILPGIIKISYLSSRDQLADMLTNMES